MTARTMLSILAVVGLTALAYPLRDANAQSPAGEKPAAASSEKPKAEAPRRRSPKAKGWRHRGGSHPHYGRRY